MKQRCLLLMTGLICASAMPTLALTISPGRTEIRLKPGEKMQGVITATNDTPERVKLVVSTKDWFVLEANKAKNLSVNRWLRLKGKKGFDLKPGKSHVLKFIASCPRDGEGELVAMVSFMDISHPEGMTTPVISVSVYLGIDGTEKVEGQVDQLAIQSWKGQLQAAVSMKSTGNVHLRPTGTISVASSNGDEIAQFRLKDGGPAYPGNKQVYFAEVPSDFKLAKGSYALRTHLEYRGLTWDQTRTFTMSSDGQVKMNPA